MAWRARHGQDQEFLEKVARWQIEQGLPDPIPEALRLRPQLSEAAARADHAWIVLSCARRFDQGMPLAIAPTEVLAWMSAHEVPQQDQGDLMDLLVMADVHYLAEVRKKREAATGEHAS